MKYQEKFNIINSLKKGYFLERKVFSLDIPKEECSKQFIKQLIDNYSWIPECYLNFLEKFNGGEFDDVRLLGDENCKNGSILSTTKMLGPFSINCIPIAKDSAGDIFWLEKNRQVVWGMIDNLENKKSSTLISDSFEDFINDYCLGKNYKKHYGENEWTKFLEEQGWA